MPIVEHTLRPLVLSAIALACTGKTDNGSHGDSAAIGGYTDSGPSVSDSGTGPSDEALDNQTRLAFIANGDPVVTDTDGYPMIPVRPASETWSSLTYVHLNRKGTALGFSLSTDNANIRPFGALIDPVSSSITATQLNAEVSRSKGPVPDEAGEVWGWIQYGGTTSPTNLIRLTSLDGTAQPGDAAAGWTQVWGYDFFEDGRFVTIYSDNSVDGPLWALDPTTETSTQLSDTVFFDHLEVGPADKVLGTIMAGFGIYDPATQTTTEHTIFPWEDPIACPPAGPSGDDPFCYYEMVHPDWSPDGTKIVFLGRAGLVTYDDRDGDVFVYDMASGETQRLTDDDVRDWTPRFSGDGQWVYWLRESHQLVRSPADGSGDMEIIWEGQSASGSLQVAWPSQ